MDEIISYKMCAVKVRNAKLRNYLKALHCDSVTRHMSGEYISVSNGKRLVSNVKKRAKMFAVCAWMQIAVYVVFL